MILSFQAVVQDAEFRDLLVVRNECRVGMTGSDAEITLDEQLEFMEKCWVVTRETWYEPYLLYDDGWPIGYGMLKWDGQKYWMTIGVVKGHRGKGLSHVLTGLITTLGRRDRKEVWLDCFDHNVGRFAYTQYGYELVDRKGNLLIMKYA